jgi:hypothetical protein
VGPDLTDWLVFPSTRSWLASHPVLNFDHLDYEAATWLEKRVKPGDRVLVNFPEENNFSILYESTLTGITGARCVGHALPLEDEKIGTTPFRRSPAAQLFWETRRVEPLRQLQVDWLFVRGDNLEKAPDLPGTTLVHQFKDGERKRFVYQVQKEELPTLLSEPQSDEKPVEVRVSSSTDLVRGGNVYYLHFESSTEAGRLFQGTAHLSTVRQSDGLVSSASENLKLNLSAQADERGRLHFQIPFMAPYDEGEYQLKVTYFPGSNTPPLAFPDIEFRSNFNRALRDVELVEVNVTAPPLAGKGPWPPRTLLKVSAKLVLPPDLPEPRTLLACWAFYSEEREEFDLLPAINMREVTLQEALTELPLVTPRKEGRYRLSLYLSGGQGQLVRVLGPTVTIMSEPK